MHSEYAFLDDGKAQDSANNTEGVAMEGKEETQGGEEGTEEDSVAGRTRRIHVYIYVYTYIYTYMYIYICYVYIHICI